MHFPSKVQRPCPDMASGRPAPSSWPGAAPETLWVSDGTAAGTKLVRDIRQGHGHRAVTGHHVQAERTSAIASSTPVMSNVAVVEPPSAVRARATSRVSPRSDLAISTAPTRPAVFPSATDQVVVLDRPIAGPGLDHDGTGGQSSVQAMSATVVSP